MSDQRNIDAYTHTHLRERRKRIWRIGSTPLPGIGIQSGIVALTAAVAAGSFTHWLVVGRFGLSDFVGLIAWVFAAAVGVGVYFLWNLETRDKMTMLQMVLAFIDYQFQPKVIQGLTRDREPSDIHWRVILWRPTDAGWHAAFEYWERALRQGSSAIADDTDHHDTAGMVQS